MAAFVSATLRSVSRTRTSPDELTWVVQGPGISPSNFDVPAILSAATAYIALLEAIAHQRNAPFRLTGMRIEEGSVALKFPVDNPMEAGSAARDARDYLSGSRPPARGLTALIKTARQSMRRLPEGQTATIRIADFEMQVARYDEEPDAERAEFISMRGVVMRVGGNPSKVAVGSDVDGWFVLGLSEAHAREIAHVLYREVELSAEITRSSEGKITGGTLLDFAQVEDVHDEGEAARWRKWFEEAGGDWNEIDDIEKELERVRSRARDEQAVR